MQCRLDDYLRKGKGTENREKEEIGLREKKPIRTYALHSEII